VIAEQLLSLEYPLDLLDLLDGNPRRGDVEAVKRSYRQFGQRKPIVARHKADGRGEVTAGNTQCTAARELEWTTIAVVWCDDDDLTARAWALADNHTADLGVYDEDSLVAFLEVVSAQGDAVLLAATGYTEADLARLLGSTFAPTDAPAARLDEVTPQCCPQCGFKWRTGVGGEVVAVDD
jgi:ParB-like chromosome segregation protein Spo0J